MATTNDHAATNLAHDAGYALGMAHGLDAARKIIDENTQTNATRAQIESLRVHWQTEQNRILGLPKAVQL